MFVKTIKIKKIKKKKKQQQKEYWLFPAHAQVDQFIAYRFFYLNLPDVNCTCICDVR